MAVKILFAGIGAVGGYFGGLMSKEFENSSDCKIYFLARGKNLEAIKNNGLRIVSPENDFITRPSDVSDHFEEKFDYIFLNCKNYDLEELIRNIEKNVSATTVLIPLLNGVEAYEILMDKFPNNLVCNGCVYIVSRLTEAGTVERFGNVQKLNFGKENLDDQRLDALARLLKQSKINVNYTEKIDSVCWQKFIFISSVATATSYLDNNLGQIKNDGDKNRFLYDLIEESISVAKAKGISLPDDIMEITKEMLGNMQDDTTSSMHSDYLAKKDKTEVETLTGYIIRQGKILNVSTPNYEIAYQKLKK